VENIMTPKVAFVIVVAVVLSGCARVVVVDPEVAAARNASDWTVKREPGKAAAVPASIPPKAGAPAPSAAESSAAEPKKD
jgi:hypothetical protein